MSAEWLFGLLTGIPIGVAYCVAVVEVTNWKDVRR